MLRKIYEELIAIRTELRLIRENTEPFIGEEGGIRIETLCAGRLMPTKVTFSLTYRDWLKLKKSKEWKEIKKSIFEYQKKYNN